MESSIYIPPLKSSKVEEEIKLDFSDVLIRPQESSVLSRKDVNLFERGNIPLILANMDTTGTFEMFEATKRLGTMVALHKHYSSNEINTFLENNSKRSRQIFYSMGTGESDIEKFNQCSHLIKNVCIDVANGYIDSIIETITYVRQILPDAFIMAGNVVCGERTKALIKAGASCVKIGVGPGSTCITRKVAGVGCPQFSAILECAEAAHSVGGLLCADGGCTSSGDIAKAYGAGADYVMIAGLVSGAVELDSPKVVIDGERFNIFYGMSSTKAMDKHNGGKASYRASEGKSVMRPITGSAYDIMGELLGDIRSAMTYVGASTLPEFRERVTFIRVNRQLNTVFSNNGE